jgi:5-methylcytosine-specific restriction protein A
MAMRKRRTPQQREAICIAHEWVCGLCKHGIDPVKQKWDLDHVIPLAAGGTDEDDNLHPVHRRCHKDKTKSDVGDIAKINRVRARHLGTKTKSARGFRGWRKFDGTPVYRNERN